MPRLPLLLLLLGLLSGGTPPVWATLGEEAMPSDPVPAAWRVGIRHASLGPDYRLREMGLVSRDLGDTLVGTLTAGSARVDKRHAERVEVKTKTSMATAEIDWRLLKYLFVGTGLYWQKTEAHVYETFDGVEVSELYAADAVTLGGALRFGTEWRWGPVHARVNWIEQGYPLRNVRADYRIKDYPVDAAEEDYRDARSELKGGMRSPYTLFGVSVAYVLPL